MAVHESKGMGFLDDLPWIFAGSVMMSSHRDHLFADELASQILEFLLFREEVKSEARGTSVVLRHHLGGGQAAQEKVEGALSSMVTNHLN